MSHREAKLGLFSWDVMEPLVKLMILFAGVVLLVISISSGVLFSKSELDMANFENRIFRILFLSSTLIFVSSIIFRTVMWFKYFAYDSSKVNEWPEVTVIVPVYNESSTVLETIRSVANCSYPVSKLKIITVNDGSKDDSLDHMIRAKNEYPGIVEVVSFSDNRGKRIALYTAFKMIKSPYIITIDSDTKLEKNALKEILCPMILNDSIGAVTGRIKVWNHSANIFTKMMNAHFAMAFDFTRAIQATFETVLCLSGAFSAYRASLINRVKDEWLNQVFLNAACTYGEDRSLTNHILREGHGTYFQRTAVSFTKIPPGLFMILKMLTRWARSNIRESIIFSGLIFHPNRPKNRLKPFLEFYFTVSILLIHFLWFYYFLFSGLIDAGLIFRIVSYSVFSGFFYILYFMRIEGSKDAPYIIFFSLFSTFFMIWIFTFAGLTLNKKGWSTR